MSIRVIVFDFDGTLIESRQLKYDAYFELFSKDEHRTRTIRSVLEEIYEESRYVILETIVKRLEGMAARDLEGRAKELARQYNEIVLSGAKRCPERSGAQKALEALAQRYNLYLISTTPEEGLKEVVRSRKWNDYFVDVFGYPREKSGTLKRIIEREKAEKAEVLVIGDGESDRKAAMENACPFIHVTEAFRFEMLDRMIAAL